jgi:hypothetical protein
MSTADVPAAGTTHTGLVVLDETVDQQPSHGRQRVSGCGVWAKPVLAAVTMMAAAIDNIGIFMVLTPFGARGEVIGAI